MQGVLTKSMGEWHKALWVLWRPSFFLSLPSGDGSSALGEKHPRMFTFLSTIWPQLGLSTCK